MGCNACNSVYRAPPPVSAGGPSKMASEGRKRVRNVDCKTAASMRLALGAQAGRRPAGHAAPPMSTPAADARVGGRGESQAPPAGARCHPRHHGIDASAEARRPYVVLANPVLSTSHLSALEAHV